MALSKKTTILFPPELHARLTHLAKRRGVSLGELVRTAVERQYDVPGPEERVAAVTAMAELQLPVGTPRELERESIPGPEELLP